MLMKFLLSGSKFNVEGTLIAQNRQVLRTSFDTTKSPSIQMHILDGEINLKELCKNFVRAIKPEDEVQFIRADYAKKGSDDSRHQLLMTTEGDIDTILIQEYKVRDLRVRPKDQKDITGYVHAQKDSFFPLIEKNAKLCMYDEKK